MATDDNNGFKTMSENADAETGGEGVGDGLVKSARGVADKVSSKLKSVGVDADGAIDMMEERATNLQDVLMDEIQLRPFRALGWAAAAGLVFGIMASR